MLPLTARPQSWHEHLNYVGFKLLVVDRAISHHERNHSAHTQVCYQRGLTITGHLANDRRAHDYVMFVQSLSLRLRYILLQEGQSNGRASISPIGGYCFTGLAISIVRLAPRLLEAYISSSASRISCSIPE